MVSRAPSRRTLLRCAEEAFSAAPVSTYSCCAFLLGFFFHHPSFSLFCLHHIIQQHHVALCMCLRITVLGSTHECLWFQQALWHRSAMHTSVTPDCHWTRPTHTGVRDHPGCPGVARCEHQSVRSPPAQSPRASPQWTRHTGLSFPEDAGAVTTAEPGLEVATGSVSLVPLLQMHGSGCTHASL